MMVTCGVPQAPSHPLFSSSLVDSPRLRTSVTGRNSISICSPGLSWNLILHLPTDQDHLHIPLTSQTQNAKNGTIIFLFPSNVSDLGHCPSRSLSQKILGVIFPSYFSLTGIMT